MSNSQYKEVIGNKLRAYRESIDETQEEFAKIQTGEDIIIPAAEWIKRTSNGGNNV